MGRTEQGYRPANTAEGEGFEPSIGFPIAVFKTAAIGH